MQKGREIKPHIGIFGRRNTGKSSLINLLCGQELSIVSPIAGTTTDPVKKSIEMEGVGACVIIDTAGIDDVGDLGSQRIKKTRNILSQVDCAILVITENCFGKAEEQLLKALNDKEIPFMVVYNKSDLQLPDAELEKALSEKYGVRMIPFSVNGGYPVHLITDELKKLIPESAYIMHSMLEGIISPGDVVLLVTPVDSEAPEGRMILPQVQVIRDVLDNDGIVVVTKEDRLREHLEKMNPKPVLVITDSQAFGKVSKEVPENISLTSFSIMLARHKGDYRHYYEGTPAISQLHDGDQVLILESCTHHVSCDDIGRVKIPRWLAAFTGKDLKFDVVAGLSPLPDDIRKYALVIQCGGCVITRKQVLNRVKPFVEAGIPVTNYGMAIAWVHGIYNRVTAPFFL